MKNFKRMIALCMAVVMCLSLAAFASAAPASGTTDVTSDGGSATSSVTLSSTADGSLDGDSAATAMSVTIPTVLPIAVGTDGTVSTATDAKIVNNSYGAVKVSSVTIDAARNWTLTAFGDKSTLAHEKVDSNKFGFALSIGGGAQKATNSSDAASQKLLTEAVEGCYMSGNGDLEANSVTIDYDAIVTPVSTAVTNTAVASVLFVITWDK